MLTRCPSCATHFRVTPEQLKARAGRVRCGECQNVFNALDTLIEEPVVISAPAAPATPEPVAVALVAEARASEHEAAPLAAMAAVAVPPAPTIEELPEPAPSVAESSFTPFKEFPESVPEAFVAPTEHHAEPEGPPSRAPEAVVIEVKDGESEARSFPLPAAEPSDDTEDWSISYPGPPPPSRWPWVVASLFPLAALLVQAVLAFRVELSVLWPESKPNLVALCEVVGCEVGFPAKIGLVGIEASDLHPDSGHKGRLALSALLKNRAPFAQQFPHLELTLTDTADKAIARKVLTPADYLPPKTSLANGMPPNADIAVAVSVDSGEMAASGYRLYVFYP